MQPLNLNSKPLTSIIAIGLGDFGSAVLHTVCQDGSMTDPPPVLITAGPDGWRQLNSISRQSDGEFTSAEEWVARFTGPGQKCLRDAFMSRRANSNRPDGLAVVIIGHLQEPFGVSLWQPILQIARGIIPPGMRLTITLLFGIDTPSLGLYSEQEWAELHLALSRLSQELMETDSTGLNKTARGIDWCYLLDTLDMNSFPLQPLQVGDSDPRTVQIHQAARFIRWMADGLIDHPQYLRTRCEQIRRDHGDKVPRPWVGSFAAGRCIFPPPGMEHEQVIRLARAILKEGLMGEIHPTDPVWAAAMRQRWMDECSLEQNTLQQRLLTGQCGQSATFGLTPPDLRGANPGELLGRLDTWRTDLERRWQSEDTWRAVVAGNQREATGIALRWLDANLDQALNRSARGVIRVRLFVQAALKAIADQRIMIPSITMPRKRWQWAVLQRAWGWLTNKFGPDWMVNLEAARNKLQETIRVREGYMARWSFALQMGWRSTSKLVNGYLAFFLCSLLMGLFVGPAILLFHAVMFTILLAVTWLPALIHPVWEVLCNEIQMQWAYQQIIQQTQANYRQLMQETLLEAQSAFYQELETALRHQAETTNRQAEYLQNVERALDSLTTDTDKPLLTDHVFCTPLCSTDRPDLFNPVSLENLAEDFCRDQKPYPAPTVSPAELAASLVPFSQHVLQEQVPSMPFSMQLDAAYRHHFSNHELSGDPLAFWLHHLFSRLCPAYPLDFTESSTAKMMLTRFYGIPQPRKDSIDANLAKPMPDSKDFEELHRLLCCDPDSLNGLVLLHLLDLDRLAAFTISAEGGEC